MCWMWEDREEECGRAGEKEKEAGGVEEKDRVKQKWVKRGSIEERKKWLGEEIEKMNEEESRERWGVGNERKGRVDRSCK